MRDRGPFPIVEGQVSIIVIQNVPTPPHDDARRPDPSVFAPTEGQLAEKPETDPADVTLHYTNRTGTHLDLVLYPYGVVDDADPWKLKARWLDFPMRDESNFYDEFKSGSGWFGIWIRDGKARYWPMGLYNLFIAPEVRLSIDNATSELGSPYQLRFETNDLRDGE
jgi:hypothetical protein